MHCSSTEQQGDIGRHAPDRPWCPGPNCSRPTVHHVRLTCTQRAAHNGGPSGAPRTLQAPPLFTCTEQGVMMLSPAHCRSQLPSCERLLAHCQLLTCADSSMRRMLPSRVGRHAARHYEPVLMLRIVRSKRAPLQHHNCMCCDGRRRLSAVLDQRLQPATLLSRSAHRICMPCCRQGAAWSTRFCLCLLILQTAPLRVKFTSALFLCPCCYSTSGTLGICTVRHVKRYA